MAKQLTLEAAERIIAACKRKAAEIGQPMNIAVVDGGANLVAFARMDGTKLVGTDISQHKALTAVYFQMDTREVVPLVQPGRAAVWHRGTSQGRLVVLGGGVLLTDEHGQVAGGVGVSAGTVEQDHDVAAAGAAVFCPARSSWIGVRWEDACPRGLPVEVGPSALNGPRRVSGAGDRNGFSLLNASWEIMLHG